ncbi:MAG: hypothetical protein HC852_22895 [Acaryochloridaceae cyanobacterium RU_4_10]|nr:hypothetical protein [Acaryochloridaceae cyanobacterium RU_4_10]
MVNAVCEVLEHPDRMLEIRRQARQTKLGCLSQSRVSAVLKLNSAG